MLGSRNEHRTRMPMASHSKVVAGLRKNKTECRSRSTASDAVRPIICVLRQADTPGGHPRGRHTPAARVPSLAQQFPNRLLEGSASSDSSPSTSGLFLRGRHSISFPAKSFLADNPEEIHKHCVPDGQSD